MTEEARQAYRSALRHAAEVPLAAAGACQETLALLDQIAPRVKPVMVSDLTTARALLRAGLEGALANAEINVGSLRELGEEPSDLVGELDRLRPRA